MKKFLLLVIFCLISTSCAWTFKLLNPDIGKRYMVKNIRDVIFYEGPSLKSPAFSLQKPEILTIVKGVCPEGKFSCNIEMWKDAYSVFYKVRFDSGKEGYINTKYFYQPTYAKHLVREEYYQLSPPAAPKESIICEPIWWKKDSFRCREE